MVGPELRFDIQRFIDEVDELVGVDVEKVTPAIQTRVTRNYLPQALACNEQVRHGVLQELVAAWRDNEDHGNRRRFGRATVNLAHFCLSRTDLRDFSGQELRHAVDSIVRISRWYHTDNNLWIRFRPYARQVVEHLWGGIEVF